MLELGRPSMHDRSMSTSAHFSVVEAVAVLSRTPAVLDALLGGMPSIWVQGNEGEQTWSAGDIVGHLVYAERNDWMPRVRIVLESGEARTFDSFDRFAQMRERRNIAMDQLLHEFSGARRASLAALDELKIEQEDLTRRGKHPVLGVITLSQLLATWAVHDLTHLHQLSRVMAHQYRDMVGPWGAYLGVLQCTGHSSS